MAFRLDSDSDSWISYNRWSMTNVSQGSSLCWLHLFGIYLVTAITVYYIEQEFIVYAKVRHDFLRQVSISRDSCLCYRYEYEELLSISIL